MLETKTINGNRSIISPGIYKIVSNKGVKIETSRFLKNSISSNKFSIIPKE